MIEAYAVAQDVSRDGLSREVNSPFELAAVTDTF